MGYNVTTELAMNDSLRHLLNMSVEKGGHELNVDLVGRTIALTGAEGRSAVVYLSKSGQVTSLAVYQKNGSFETLLEQKDEGKTEYLANWSYAYAPKRWAEHARKA